MDVSYTSAKLTLLGGLGAASLLVASVAVPEWTHKTGHYGQMNMGLWQFCHIYVDGSSMCDYLDLGFTGSWPAVRILMCFAVASMMGALFFNAKECFSATRQFEKHTVICYILSGILTIGAIVAFLVQDALRPFMSSGFWVALSSAPATVGVGLAFQMTIMHRNKKIKKVLDAMDASYSSEEEGDNMSRDWISLASVITTRSTQYNTV